MIVEGWEQGPCQISETVHAVFDKARVGVVEESMLEATAVGDERVMTGESEQFVDRFGTLGCFGQRIGRDIQQSGDVLGDAACRLHIRVVSIDDLTIVHSGSADLDDLVRSGIEPGRFEIDGCEVSEKRQDVVREP